MKIARWGNSLAVRLPASLVEALDLKEGDEVELATAGENAFEVSRASSPEDRIEKLRAFRGWLPAGYRFNRDEANER